MALTTTSTSPSSKKLKQALTRLSELNVLKTNLFASGKKDGTSIHLNDLISVIELIKAKELEIKELEEELETTLEKKTVSIDNNQVVDTLKSDNYCRFAAMMSFSHDTVNDLLVGCIVGVPSDTCGAPGDGVAASGSRAALSA